MSQAPAQVVVVGSGFAGFFAARKLARILPRELAEVTMVSATDHLGYSPLLPEVVAGRLDPQRIAVPLHGSLGGSRILQGRVEHIDFERRKVRVACGEELSLPYDRLVLATGSVTREVATPGLSDLDRPGAGDPWPGGGVPGNEADLPWPAAQGRRDAGGRRGDGDRPPTAGRKVH